MAVPTVEKLKPLSEPASTPTDQQCGLFELPPELRLSIYEMLFAQLSNTAGSDRKDLEFLAALLYTSKRLFMEARPAFLKHADETVDRLKLKKAVAENDYKFGPRASRSRIEYYNSYLDRKRDFNRASQAVACVKQSEILLGRWRLEKTMKNHLEPFRKRTYCDLIGFEDTYLEDLISWVTLGGMTARPSVAEYYGLVDSGDKGSDYEEFISRDLRAPSMGRPLNYFAPRTYTCSAPLSNTIVADTLPHGFPAEHSNLQTKDGSSDHGDHGTEGKGSSNSDPEHR